MYQLRHKEPNTWIAITDAVIAGLVVESGYQFVVANDVDGTPIYCFFRSSDVAPTPYDVIAGFQFESDVDPIEIDPVLIAAAIALKYRSVAAVVDAANIESDGSTSSPGVYGTRGNITVDTDPIDIFTINSAGLIANVHLEGAIYDILVPEDYIPLAVVTQEINDFCDVMANFNAALNPQHDLSFYKIQAGIYRLKVTAGSRLLYLVQKRTIGKLD